MIFSTISDIEVIRVTFVHLTQVPPREGAMMLGQFESSLRGRASWSGGEDPLQKKTLHKTCSGHAHGHGVRKERTVKGGCHSIKITASPSKGTVSRDDILH